MTVTNLFPAVDDVLGVVEPPLGRPPCHRVVPRGGVGHLHGRELQEGLAQSHSTQQQLSETQGNARKE